ncbi:MAG: NAD(P)/FAD-dependent oxidoreductase [Acidimicrobiia bacterium]|nr:NAD(P)/FAD-dependent oxidoreductase [Acidimicrobiia bacterium]
MSGSDVRTTSDPDVVIVGAGLAGLAAAGTLTRAGRSVVLLEASDGVGGRVRTDVVDGYRLDRGFQVLLTAYPELERQVDLDALDVRCFEPGALVWNGTKLSVMGDPLRRPRAALPTVVAPIGSVGDKLRILRQRERLRRADPVDLLRQDDRSTESALRDQGFGNRMIDLLFRPLVGGIQLDPSLSTSRRMFDVVLRSLIVGDAGVPAKGMGSLSDQLGDALPEGVVRLSSPVAEVSPGGVVLATGQELRADRVVVATEGPAASALLGLPPVESNPATCVWFGADRSPIDAGYIVLDGTGAGPATNVAVLSDVAPDYAPSGRSLIAAACPGIADVAVEARVRDQLGRIWGASVEGWTHLRTDVIEHGQPRQPPGFSPKQRVALGDGLFVCGDHRDTSSIQGALFSGRRCGEAVLDSLT